MKPLTFHTACSRWSLQNLIIQFYQAAARAAAFFRFLASQADPLRRVRWRRAGAAPRGRCGYLGENSKGWPCPFGRKYAGMHYEGG